MDSKCEEVETQIRVVGGIFLVVVRLEHVRYQSNLCKPSLLSHWRAAATSAAQKPTALKLALCYSLLVYKVQNSFRV